jgi:mono/diheme cytochrome c family protein
MAMRRLRFEPGAVAAVAVAALLALTVLEPSGARADEEAVERGGVLAGAAGCANCHTAEGGDRLAGGRAIPTPFGTFRSPNISPHLEHGIGGWSDADFVRAMREGTAPDGRHYYPSFPYTSYTLMTDEDILAIKAYLSSQPAVDAPSRGHDLSFPFDQRWALYGWKQLFLEPGPFEPDPDRSAAWNRGAYLVEAVTHCGECHTPRNRWTGALDRSRWLAGTADGPEGETAPNITPHAATGIGGWSDGDLRFLLQLGMMPDGDVVGSLMHEVVEDGTASLPRDDLDAIIAYLRSLPPIENTEAPASRP